MHFNDLSVLARQKYGDLDLGASYARWIGVISAADCRARPTLLLASSTVLTIITVGALAGAAVTVISRSAGRIQRKH